MTNLSVICAEANVSERIVNLPYLINSDPKLKSMENIHKDLMYQIYLQEVGPILQYLIIQDTLGTATMQKYNLYSLKEVLNSPYNSLVKEIYPLNYLETLREYVEGGASKPIEPISAEHRTTLRLLLQLYQTLEKKRHTPLANTSLFDRIWMTHYM